MSEMSPNLGGYPAVNSTGAFMGSVGIQGPLHSSRLSLAQTYPNVQLTAMSAKSACPGAVPLNYANEASDSYGSVSPHFILPSQEHQGCPPMVPQESFRDWNSTSHNSRPAGGLFFDQESHPYNSHLPCINPSTSRVPSMASDGSSFFPALGSLSSSLPLASSSGDRVLPKPHHAQVGCSGSNVGSDLLPASYNLWDGVSYKSLQQPWGSESRNSSGSQESRRASSGSSSEALEASAAKTSLTPPQESSLGYPPTSGHPTGQDSATAALSYSQNHASTPGQQTSFSGSDILTYPPVSVAPDTTLPSHASSSNLYSYSSGSTYKNGNHGSSNGTQEGTLVSGQPYTRLVHTQQPSKINAYGSLRPGPMEARPPSSHRSSVGGFRA